MSIRIGSYEAKTRLPELLREVQAGQRYTITLRGRAVACLVPAEHDRQADAGSAAREMLAFMLNRSPVAGVDMKLKELIEEGRA